MDLLLKVALEVSSNKETESSGWYNFSRNLLKPFMNKRTQVLDIIRQNYFHKDVTQNMAKEVKKHLIDGIELAKSK